MKNKILLFAILILSLIPVLNLLHPGFPITHDGQDHVARIANFYQNLINGNLIPRWAPNLNWGYGHPILEFLYPLPSYIASGLHFIGFSLVDSTKIVLALGMVMSLPFMFLWLSQFTSKNAALFGAILYTYAPYRFVELYVRGDIGENLAFPFIPLVLYFIYKLYKHNNLNYVLFGGLSLSLLILAHNAISLMIMPFIIIYAMLLFYFTNSKKKFFINFSLLLLIGFSLSAFFWIPALLEGKYTLRNIVTAGGYLTRFVSIDQLIYGPWSYGGSGQFTVQYGIFQLIAIALSPLVILKNKQNKEKVILCLILIGLTVFSTFIMLPVSNFIWTKVMLLQNFQFPWRFLALVVFSSSVLGSLLFDLSPKKLSAKLLIISALIIVLISSYYSKPKDYQYKPEAFYSSIYNSTTDTGESAPIWSIRFMEHTFSSPAQIIEGKGEIKEVIHMPTYRKFIYNSDSSARVLINILYFPKWSIYVNGKETPILFQDPMYRGLLTFHVNASTKIIEVRFNDTNLRKFADLLSLLSLISVSLVFTIRFVKRKFY